MAEQHDGAQKRRAWLVLGSLFTVASLIFGVQQTVSLVAHEERTDVRLIDAEGLAGLRIDSEAGAIDIVGTDRDDIAITARISDGLSPTDYDVDVVGDVLEVRVRCTTPMGSPWCRVGLRIEVPARVRIDVRSEADRISVRSVDGSVLAGSENGAVAAEALGGPTVLRSENGSVEASRMATGGVEAHSENGSVRVDLAVPAVSVLASTENGSAEVVVPSGPTSYAVTVDSGNGRAENLVRSDPASDATISVRSANGDAIVRYSG